MQFENVIWEGRFQPIHLGHVAYVRKLLEYAKHLLVFVVENERSSDLGFNPNDLPVPEFTEIVDAHHAPEKNPLPFWFRYRLVVETLRDEFPDAPIIIWGGRRLDLSWPFSVKTLPPGRIFIIPERDSFEDAKAAAWTKLGEKVMRIDVSTLPKISASLLRERIRSGQRVDDLLCPTTERILRETGFYEKIAQQ